MNPPKIDNAPGLKWKRRRNGWEARWQARDDLVKRGYAIKSMKLKLWCGQGLTPTEIAFIQDRCNSLQAEMLVWGRGGIPQAGIFDGTIAGLIRCYQTDKDSPYKERRYRTRIYYDTLCKRIESDLGDKLITELDAREILRWHRGFMDAGHVAMGHAVIGMLRGILTFGKTFFKGDEKRDCAELREILRDMRFPVPPARKSILTAEQVTAIRAECHKMGFPSIALAQAFQFEAMLRQKDVIGEWVPINERGLSDYIDGNNKWLRGIQWQEIDKNMVLTHITSKRQKEICVDLKLAPMVMEELGNRPRDGLGSYGPIIVSESSGVPWHPVEFRRLWRLAATSCGIPKSIRNMDSRAGAITEATQSGASLESIKHAATHSDIGMTQRYARGAEEKTADVMRLRAEHRANKSVVNKA